MKLRTQSGSGQLAAGKYLLQKLGDGFGQLAGIVGANHGQREAAGEPVACYPIRLEKAIPATQRVLPEYRVSEPRLHQSLDTSIRKKAD